MEPRKAELEGVLEVPTLFFRVGETEARDNLSCPMAHSCLQERVSVLGFMLGKVGVCSQALSCVHVAPAAAFRLV